MYNKTYNSFTGGNDISMGDLNKYEIFLKAAEIGSFKKTADELNYTQAGIAYVITSLEKEFGISLFIRNYGEVTLSSEGKMLLPYIQNICTHEKKLRNIIDEIKHLDAGYVTVGVFTSFYVTCFARLVRLFGEKHPHIKIIPYYTDEQDKLTDKAVSGEIDLAFGIAPVPEILKSVKLLEDPIVAILPQGHPLTEKEHLSVSDLQNTPYVQNENGTYSEVDNIFNRYDIKPHVAATTQNDFVTVAMVEEGFGYALVPAIFCNAVNNSVVIKPLEIDAKREIDVFYNQALPLSNAAREFLEVTEEFFSDSENYFFKLFKKNVFKPRL